MKKPIYLLLILSLLLVGCGKGATGIFETNTIDYSEVALSWIKNRLDTNSDAILNYDTDWMLKNNPTSGEVSIINTFKTYSLDDATYLYDQALAVIALSMAKEKAYAKRALAKLITWQRSDGGFPFSTAPLASEYVGTSAWVGLAINYYAKTFNDQTYNTNANKLASHLMTLQHSSGLLKGNDTVSWASTEHNIDAYFFLRDLGYTNDANQIKTALLTYCWDSTKKTFQRGYADTVDALDCSTWGAMFLLSIGETTKAAQALNYADNFYTHDDNIYGYARGENYETKGHVWSEGTLGYAMAVLKLNDKSKALTLYQEMIKIQNLDPNGGLLYCTDTYEEHPDNPMLRAPSPAGTTWFVMVKKMLEDSSLIDTFWGKN